MSKKDFIFLGDSLREYRYKSTSTTEFEYKQLVKFFSDKLKEKFVKFDDNKFITYCLKPFERKL